MTKRRSGQARVPGFDTISGAGTETGVNGTGSGANSLQPWPAHLRFRTNTKNMHGPWQHQLNTMVHWTSGGIQRQG
eukprot:12897650-Prorocentrum_lima.AAC.1